MAVSKYTKAPTFVSNYSENMATLQRHDKELQRINQDYALADQAISKFKNNIDIIKLDAKNYFDNKYTQAVSTFGESIDLTKRNQVYKTEGLLSSIIDDPIIKNGMQSTRNIRELMKARATINSNPKYMELRKPEDEYVDNLKVNEYINNKDLNASFSQATPTVTMNTDKHYASIIKEIPFEDKVDSNGVVNIFSKIKTGEKISNTLWNEMVSNPGVVAAEKNKFEYLYKTPEAKQQYADSAMSLKQTRLKQIATQLSDIHTVFAGIKPNDPETSALQLSQLKQKESTLLNQKAMLESNTVDPFQLYLLNKSFQAGVNNASTKDTKVVLDPQKKYFTEVRLKDRDYNYKVNKDAQDYKLKVAEYERRVKKDANDLKATAAEKVATTGGSLIDPSGLSREAAAFEPYTMEGFYSDQKQLRDTNQSLMQGIAETLNNTPGSYVSKMYNKFVNQGLITFNAKKGVLVNDDKLKQLFLLKDALVKDAVGIEVADQTKDFIIKLEQIRENNIEHRIKENLHKKALKESGFDGTKEWYSGFQPTYNEYLKIAPKYLSKRDQNIVVPIANLRQDNDSVKFENSNIRETFKQYLNNNGLINSKGERIRTQQTLGDQRFTDDNVMSQETYDSINFDNSLSNVVVRNGKPQIKLTLVPKGTGEKAAIKNNTFFKDNVAYVDVPPAFADIILQRSGANTSSQKLAQNSNKWNYISSIKDLSLKDKQSLISDNMGLSTPMILLGNVPATYSIQARSDNMYNVSLNLGSNIILEPRVVTNPDDYSQFMQQQANLFKQKLEANDQYSLDIFKKGIVAINNSYKN